MHMNAYIVRRIPVLRSRMTAMSGMSATRTNSVLAVRYVFTALGSQMRGERTFIHTPLEKSYGNTQ